MYAEVFATIAPIFICAATGFFWQRYAKSPFDSDMVSHLVMNIGAPCLVVGTLSKVALPAQSLLLVITAATLVLATTALIAALLCRLCKLDYSIYLGSLTFPNTVNMGLPVSLFAFGDEGLAIALGIYLVVSICHFSLGVALVSGQNAWRNTLRSPVVYAALLAGGLVFTGTQLPLWLENSVTLLGSLTIPLMLITLGVSLSQLKVRDFGLSCVLAAARLLIGVAVGIAIAELLSLQGTMRSVVIVQSTMPAAVFNYLLARRYNRAPETVAGLVVMSTLLSFISLPVLLWLLLE